LQTNRRRVLFQRHDAASCGGLIAALATRKAGAWNQRAAQDLDCMARPRPDEFAFTDSAVTHTPTGHRIMFRPDGAGKGHFERGHELRVLEYDAEAVRRMAKRLWVRRHADHGMEVS
jgi:hypothetical protein